MFFYIITDLQHQQISEIIFLGLDIISPDIRPHCNVAIIAFL